ncbi:hypothetical protein ACFORL_03170 [Legionella dresdenensis]|uniref:Tetratricopeptide repeat protein n=1 Tax=Legionella dresdenensis TaxID=450200 RepID=A0ABV8CCN5_9GAMM
MPLNDEDFDIKLYLEKMAGNGVIHDYILQQNVLSPEDMLYFINLLAENNESAIPKPSVWAKKYNTYPEVLFSTGKIAVPNTHTEGYDKITEALSTYKKSFKKEKDNFQKFMIYEAGGHLEGFYDNFDESKPGVVYSFEDDEFIDFIFLKLTTDFTQISVKTDNSKLLDYSTAFKKGDKQYSYSVTKNNEGESHPQLEFIFSCEDAKVYNIELVVTKKLLVTRDGKEYYQFNLSFNSYSENSKNSSGLLLGDFHRFLRKIPLIMGFFARNNIFAPFPGMHLSYFLVNKQFDAAVKYWALLLSLDAANDTCLLDEESIFDISRQLFYFKERNIQKKDNTAAIDYWIKLLDIQNFKPPFYAHNITYTHFKVLNLLLTAHIEALSAGTYDGELELIKNLISSGAMLFENNHSISAPFVQFNRIKKEDFKELVAQQLELYKNTFASLYKEVLPADEFESLENNCELMLKQKESLFELTAPDDTVTSDSESESNNYENSDDISSYSEDKEDTDDVVMEDLSEKTLEDFNQLLENEQEGTIEYYQRKYERAVYYSKAESFKEARQDLLENINGLRQLLNDPEFVALHGNIYSDMVINLHLLGQNYFEHDALAKLDIDEEHEVELAQKIIRTMLVTGVANQDNQDLHDLGINNEVSNLLVMACQDDAFFTPAESIAYLKKAQALQNNMEVILTLANAYLADGNPQEAIVEINEGLKLFKSDDSTLAEVYYVLGKCNYLIKNYSAAHHNFLTAQDYYGQNISEKSLTNLIYLYALTKNNPMQGRSREYSRKIRLTFNSLYQQYGAEQSGQFLRILFTTAFPAEKVFENLHEKIVKHLNVLNTTLIDFTAESNDEEAFEINSENALEDLNKRLENAGKGTIGYCQLKYQRASYYSKLRSFKEARQDLLENINDLTQLVNNPDCAHWHSNIYVDLIINLHLLVQNYFEHDLLALCEVEEADEIEAVGNVIKFMLVNLVIPQDNNRLQNLGLARYVNNLLIMACKDGEFFTPDETITYLQKAQNLEDSIEITLALANAYLAVNNPQKAMAEIKEGLKLFKPDNPILAEVYYVLGKCNFLTQKYRVAYRNFLTAQAHYEKEPSEDNLPNLIYLYALTLISDNKIQLDSSLRKQMVLTLETVYEKNSFERTISLINTLFEKYLPNHTVFAEIHTRIKNTITKLKQQSDSNFTFKNRGIPHPVFVMPESKTASLPDSHEDQKHTLE